MSYFIMVDSAHSIQVYPEIDSFKREDEKMETTHRTDGGREYRYSTGSFQSIKFDLKFISSSQQAIINSWWLTNTDLLFLDDVAGQVTSVHIVNKKKPIGKYSGIYTDQFEGSITLETF